MASESTNVFLSPQVIYGVIGFFTASFLGICGVVWKLWTESNQQKTEIKIKDALVEKENTINQLNLKVQELQQENEFLSKKHNLDIQDKENQISILQKEIELITSLSIGNIYQIATNQIQELTNVIEKKEIMISEISQQQNNKELIIVNLQEQVNQAQIEREELQIKLQTFHQILMQTDFNNLQNQEFYSEYQQQIAPDLGQEAEDNSLGSNKPTKTKSAEMLSKLTQSKIPLEIAKLAIQVLFPFTISYLDFSQVKKK